MRVGVLSGEVEDWIWFAPVPGYTTPAGRPKIRRPRLAGGPGQVEPEALKGSKKNILSFL